MSTVESIARPRRNGERRRAPTASDRKSGSAGMPRPISYAVFCLKKKKTSAQQAPVIAAGRGGERRSRLQDHSHFLLPRLPVCFFSARPLGRPLDPTPVTSSVSIPTYFFLNDPATT